MDCTGLYGHDVYIDKKLVGYIAGGQEDGNAMIWISRKKFAGFDSEGILFINGEEVGYIDDDGDIYLRSKYVGEINANNDMVFYGAKLTQQ